MYKIILVIALICTQEASSQQIIGNPFSPDDDLMTTFEKATTKKVDSQVVAVIQKPIVIEKKKDTVAVAAVKSPVTVRAKSETAVKIEESIPEVKYIQPIVKKKAITEDIFENSGLTVYAEGRTVAILFKSTTREKKYLLYKTVIQNKVLSGQKSDDSYTGSYIIPTAWWNENIADNTPRWDQIEYILLNYKVK